MGRGRPTGPARGRRRTKAPAETEFRSGRVDGRRVRRPFCGAHRAKCPDSEVRFPLQHVWSAPRRNVTPVRVQKRPSRRRRIPMLFLATLSAIAALPVIASAALGTMPTVLHINDRPSAFARSDVVRAPRNETIYIPENLDFFVGP